MYHITEPQHTRAEGRGSTPSTVGFTLIEILVSVGLFTVVVVMGMGAVLQIIDAGQKHRSMNVVMNSLNAGVEGMALQLRYGSGHSCDSIGCDAISFTSYTGELIEYNTGSGPYAGRITRSIDGAESRPLTSPDVTVTDLRFYKMGPVQSLITVVVRGEVDDGKNVS
ncbi:MAG: hypothetical protein WDZ79_00655, partial [Candidatus Paceibacterota bacterium]